MKVEAKRSLPWKVRLMPEARWSVSDSLAGAKIMEAWLRKNVPDSQWQTTRPWFRESNSLKFLGDHPLIHRGDMHPFLELRVLTEDQVALIHLVFLGDNGLIDRLTKSKTVV